MSSFIIGKKEYIKAAGIIAGIQDIKRDKFYLYNSDFGGVMIGKQYHEMFTTFFNWNCESVKEQYNDEELYTDNNDYMEIFKEYREKGNNITITGGKAFKQLLMELYQFFSSVCYQVEKEEYYNYIERVTNNIILNFIFELTGINRNDCKSWGELDISSIKFDEYESLFDGILLMKS